MDFPWERIDTFGSLRELDRFVVWMRRQIADGMAEEIDAPADTRERWFRHILTGSLWRLIPDDDPSGPGFWPAHDDGEREDASDDPFNTHGTLPQAERDRRGPIEHR